jgi:ATP-dependent DNA helicase RecG
MRPEILFPLFRTIDSLKGVGPKIAPLIQKVAGDRVRDLAFVLPVGIVDRRYQPKIIDAEPGRLATIRVRITGHQPSQSRRMPYRVVTTDATGELILVFFHSTKPYLEKLLPPGEERLVSGMVEDYRGQLQMTHPDHIVSVEDIDDLPLVEPVYPLTAGLTGKTLRKAVDQALTALPELPDWLNQPLKRQHDWPDWREALQAVHTPDSPESLDPMTLARQRLAYDELLANQLALVLVRAKQKRRPGPIIPAGDLANQAITLLPFELTGSQRHALAEIGGDLASGQRMQRLLQGDVGSGKTVVALLAMLEAVAAGGQAALMAPTEILVRQHAETIAPIAMQLGLKTVVLTGRDKGKARERLLEDIANGFAHLVLGTHSLVQDTVAFKNLTLVVVDEQHRFGVDQRMVLTDKAQDGGCHTLVMTATPIPRTLMLTAYGDLDWSRLTEKPAGRQPVDTRVVPANRLSDIVEGLERAIANGGKAYWVCPLVEESENSDLAAAEERFTALHARFGAKVGLIHGRMRAADKEAAMAAFAEGEVQLLVATTVIEVGVNVPDATIMVIEHAERFGLAQLHQLRGRVGRGVKASTCILLYHPPLGATAKARLETMRRTEDGFEIAEEDLKLRGGGEVLGTKQSGLPSFKLADLEHHADLLPIARDDARMIVETDPDLATERGAALRTLLYLFEQDAAVRYAKVG